LNLSYQRKPIEEDKTKPKSRIEIDNEVDLEFLINKLNVHRNNQSSLSSKELKTYVKQCQLKHMNPQSIQHSQKPSLDFDILNNQQDIKPINWNNYER